MYRHYRPKARVELYADPAALAARLAGAGDADSAAQSARIAVIGTNEFLDRALPDPGGGPWETRTAATLGEYARNLYRWFAEADDLGATVILAELPPPGGIGTALRDRLIRAAGE